MYSDSDVRPNYTFTTSRDTTSNILSSANMDRTIYLPLLFPLLRSLWVYQVEILMGKEGKIVAEGRGNGLV